MEIDLRQNRFLDYAALRALRAPGGRVSSARSRRVFGYADPRTLQYRGRLGLALQLINVIRDVGDDARRGRLYLPIDELQRFDVRPPTCSPAATSTASCPLMRFQAERARATYREALAFLAARHRSSRPATGTDHGRDLRHAARRDRTRELPGPAPEDRTDARAQAVDCLAHLDAAVNPPRSVAVVGGGWAGCAAAADTCRRRRARHPFEAAAELGGRGRRVELELGGTRTPLDNGQHLMVGAYTATARLLREIGVDIGTVVERRPFELRYPDGFRLEASLRPAPWHLVTALAGARGLRWRDRIAMVRLLRALKAARVGRCGPTAMPRDGSPGMVRARSSCRGYGGRWQLRP
jgi:hypothetical protein